MRQQDLRQAFTLAGAFKEGDRTIGGTADDRVRHEARSALLGTTVRQIRQTVFVDDGVSAALERSRDRSADGELDSLTIARTRDILLAPGAADWARRHRNGLGSEVIAAIAKVMTGHELATVARLLAASSGSASQEANAPAGLGSRIQPNSPGDDPEEILFSILEGLTHGCGDMIIGLNPAADDLDTIIALEELLAGAVERLALPTRYCVLSDIVKQHAARLRTRVDVGFQSLAGTSRALAGMVGLDVDGLAALTGAFEGLYFETGQGAEVTNGNAEGIDMVTLESRTYGVARHLSRRAGTAPWTIVNDVAGFIGPEVFRTAEQLERACMEDLLMARLHGLTMGLDVCATFHMGIEPAALRGLTARVVEQAAPAYLMAVAGNADPMLGYLTTSFREHPRLRQSSGRKMAAPMQRRLTALGVLDADGQPRPGPESMAQLYATYAKAGGDRRTRTALEDDARLRLRRLRERGFDLGGTAEADAEARVNAIYANARAALYAGIEEAVLADACPRFVQVRSAAIDRDDYLAHPSAGEQLAPDARRALAARAAPASAAGGRAPHVQIVISDGLNANAVNEQLRNLLPPLRRALGAASCRVGGTDVVIRNGRVRAGYEAGQVIGADVIVHVIGERPGTGLNTLSAYMTWGRDESGRLRWDRGLDHAATTAICGIHPRGKRPLSAAAEVARTVMRMVEQRRSGVALRG